MRWHDLLFAHWSVEPQLLRPLIPAGLELDTFDGRAWIGVVPFHMTGVVPRYTPELNCTSAFPEINVRTYVKNSTHAGVWFFSLDATSRLVVRVARLWYKLPYYDARIDVDREGETINYRSTRTHRGAGRADFEASYKPVGQTFHAAPQTLEHFLVERYCMFAADRKGRITRGDIHHARWQLQTAEAEIRTNTMTQPLGFELPQTAPLLHFARLIEAVAWSVAPCNE